MGSDVKSDYIFRLFIYLFNLISWKRIIVKSHDMKSSLNISSAIVVPNGVDLSLFKPLNKNLCKKKLNWSLKKKQILFPSDPSRFEKNFSLAFKAFKQLDSNKLEIKTIKNIPPAMMPIYINASDLILSTSLWKVAQMLLRRQWHVINRFYQLMLEILADYSRKFLDVISLIITPKIFQKK